MVKTIAFYLPQFHPIPENNEWYGEGFTEWTNVAKAKPLFRGHYQPHIPADLGFYDLRLKETRRAQSEMALKYGISAFCYWHYWFGGGKQLLEMPIWKMHEDPEVKIPFCIGWANTSWQNKLWDSKGNNSILLEQKYLGIEDYTKYFYNILPLLKDERYFKIDNKNLFIVYKPFDASSDQMKCFIETWRKLAKKEKIGEFFFMAQDSSCRAKDQILKLGFDAIFDNNVGGVHHDLSFIRKCILTFSRKFLKRPSIFPYKEAAKHMVNKDCTDELVYPVVAPNWDHSPRTGGRAVLYTDCDPKYFYQLLKKTIDLISHKKEEHQIIFIKSWNEWGEGNYMEPDLKYGKGYLEALEKALKEK